ncbi:MAG: hypothetical protein CMM93_03055 [Rickettsiales bacterium]|nr:hypothetical protein [Rickettsiales bacterium]|tara:strand:- start:2351 stop:2878 length:528 start_codon:yes stop_codon:yes gene_type:complete
MSILKQYPPSAFTEIFAKSITGSEIPPKILNDESDLIRVVYTSDDMKTAIIYNLKIEGKSEKLWYGELRDEMFREGYEKPEHSVNVLRGITLIDVSNADIKHYVHLLRSIGFVDITSDIKWSMSGFVGFYSNIHLLDSVRLHGNTLTVENKGKRYRFVIEIAEPKRVKNISCEDL